MEEVLGLQDTHLDLAGTRRGSNPVKCLLLWRQWNLGERSLTMRWTNVSCDHQLYLIYTQRAKEGPLIKFSQVQTVCNHKDELHEAKHGVFIFSIEA